MSEYKHFNENELEFAQHIAKLNLNKGKDRTGSTQDSAQLLKPKTISFEINDDDRNNFPSDIKLHGSHPSSSNKAAHNTNTLAKQRKYKEGNMRIKQAMRNACDLSRLIERMDRKSKEKHELSFITPLDLEQRNKRWEDFSHLAQRSLYTLKREVNLLSVKISVPLNKLPDTSLRMLASATRSCLHILKGLENFEDEIKEGQKGNFLLRETLLTGQHILFIMTMGGASLSAKNPLNVKADKMSRENSEENLTKSFEILTSDMDSKVSELLNPKAVKKKLSTLVYSLKTKNRKGKNQQLKYIYPLQDEMVYLEKSRNPFYPVIEDLDDGRKIEFVNDSLSPKLRKRNLRQVKTRSYTRQREDDRNGLHSPLKMNYCPTEENIQYDVSEKMADAVFERILPYINSTEEKELAGTSKQHGKSSIEIMVYLEAEKKLDEVQKRLNRLEMATKQHKQFLSEINSKLSKSSKNSPDALDMEDVIKKANLCLDKCSKPDNTFPYRKSSVNVIVDNLLQSHTQDLETRTLPKKSDFSSIQDEVQVLKLEFWKSLIDKNVMTSDKPDMNENAADEYENAADEDENENAADEDENENVADEDENAADKNDTAKEGKNATDKKATEEEMHNSNREEHFKEGLSELKLERSVFSYDSSQFEDANHSEKNNPFRNINFVTDEDEESISDENKNKPVEIQLSKSSNASHESKISVDRNGIPASREDDNDRSNAALSEVKTDTSAAQSNGDENSAKEF